MVRRSQRRAKEPFHHPEPGEINYDLMLEVLAMSRRETERFQYACGVRNPAYREAQALVEQIDAVARLTRVSNADERVKPVFMRRQ